MAEAFRAALATPQQVKEGDRHGTRCEPKRVILNLDVETLDYIDFPDLQARIRLHEKVLAPTTALAAASLRARAQDGGTE